MSEAAPHPETVVDLYVNERKSMKQVASMLGTNYSRVRRVLLEHGVSIRSIQEGIQLRSDHISQMNRGRKKGPVSNETRRKISRARRRHAEVHAAGVSLKPNGYMEYTRGPHKGRSVHVVKMEQRIGRRLMPDEVIHHVDGDRANNDIHNLALMTRAAHNRLHRREEKLQGNERERNEDGTFC